MIPQVLRKHVLDKLHIAHPGIRRMKALARQHFYWPGLTVEIERYVKACSRCLETSSAPLKVPLAPWPSAEKPWSRVHIDFGEPRKGKTFIVAVDSFSKFVDAQWMSSTTTEAVIQYFRQLFRILGPPETLVSDNGPQLCSESFAAFCEEFSITHLRCAPAMPMSNGQAEKFVRTIKDSMDSLTGCLDPLVAAYNYTPATALGNKSPNEVFFGRQLRTPLDKFKPRSSSTGAPTSYQQEYKEQFDRHHGAVVRAFAKGETVSIRLSNGSRVSATVKRFIGRAMLELDVQGAKVVRHRNQVWKRAASSEPTAPGPLRDNSEGSTTSPRAVLPRSCKQSVDYRRLSG